jgi:hypothetical protein
MKAGTVKVCSNVSDRFFCVLIAHIRGLRPLFPMKPAPPFAHTDRKQ